MDKDLLILASSSPRRQELIRMLGIPYRVLASDVEESMPAGTPPVEYVEQLSLRKAAAAAERLSGAESAVVIGSDTVVVLDGTIMGKPQDDDEAYSMLKRLAGQTHQVYSGLACIQVPLQAELVNSLQINDGGFAWREVKEAYGAFRFFVPENQVPYAALGWNVTHVTMRPLTDQQIRSYIAKGESADKAGAYAIQGAGSTFVQYIEGDYFNVVGLPVSQLRVMLEGFRSGTA